MTVSVVSHGPESDQKLMLPVIAAGLRGTIADALEVCRPCVSVPSIRHRSYLDDDGDGEASLVAVAGQQRVHHTTLADHMDRLMRRASSEREGLRPVTELWQVEAVYEVRIEDALGASEAEVASRVDSLQLFGRFADLNGLLRRWLENTPTPQGIVEMAFSDLGYASRREERRAPLSSEQVTACVEEGLLRGAKSSHQYVIAAAILISVMTACVGSLVFAVKVPSHIPSRMNPLITPAAQ